ncbi:MAG: thioesterase family protein [Bryobacteraceae bacterium]
MKHRHEALAGFPVVTTLPVIWGDQDAFGHVNNLVYLRWCETVRVEYLQRVGMWLPLPPQGVGPILASIHCDYKLPLNYPDTVHVGARVTRIGNSSVRMEHRIVSHKRDELAAAVDSTLVMLDYAHGRPSPVTAEIRAKIAEIEGHEFAASAQVSVERAPR